MIKVFQYLRQCPKDPDFIDKLFITAFLTKNKKTVLNNSLLRDYTFTNDEGWEYVDKFLHILSKEIQRFTLEDLVKLFEFVISPADRKVNGAIYTPAYIRNAIIDKCFAKMQNLHNARIADISCGCGGFLMDVSEKIHARYSKSYAEIYAENIFGIDVQGYSISRTKLLLSLLALMNGEDADFSFNLYQADTLGFNFRNEIRDFEGFDVIVGNPPYVCSRNISASTRELMNKWLVCSTGHPDLYIPFFQIAIENLVDNGVLGYITMNSFLKSLNGRALREYFQTNPRRIEIFDFRGKQIFPRKSTYTCLFFFQNTPSDSLYYATNEEETFSPDKTLTEISYAILDVKKGWNLNETTRMDSLETIGIPIGKFGQSRHGIATLSNKVYIFKPKSETAKFLSFIKDGVEYEIEQGICRDIVNSNKLNSDVEFSDIVEKVIFPYSVNEFGKVVVLLENVFKTKYPKAYAYLQTQRKKLAERDKGNVDGYPTWYAYGRTQSLVLPRYKLFFPKIANKQLTCKFVDDVDLMLYNGMAFVSEEAEPLQILQKILESNLFWNYVITNSKPYASGYYSLNGVNIKHFGIPNFTEEEKQYLIRLQDKDTIEEYLSLFYK